MKSRKLKKWMPLTAMAALLVGGVACGGDDGMSRVGVNLYGWIAEGGGEGEFVDGVPEYPGAFQVRVKVTRPESREILTERNFALGDRKARLPELPPGNGLRMDFEIRDSSGVAASGNTPVFNVGDEPVYRAFRTLVSPVNDFAPVGQMVRVQDSTEERLVQSRFDGRALEASPGRVGHGATVTESGEIMIVGGGDVSVFHQPASLPSLQSVLADIQLFDPATGYFTELAGDDRARASGAIGEDRLHTPRAFHTVTPLGNDQYLVVGGFEVVGNSLQASRSIEVIDLKASPGSRVRRLNDLSGNPVRLQEARGLHTATYRTNDGRVVIAGGLGSDSGAVRNSFEVINPNPQNATVDGGFQMQAARVGHNAVLMEDGRTVWLLGGKNGNGVLDTTEVLTLNEGITSSESAATMTRGRYGASVFHLGAGGNQLVALFGGFTGLTGGATASIELGRPDTSLQSENSWRIGQARGNAALIQLQQSRELLMVGGLDPDFEILPSVERIRFEGLGAVNPFSVDEPQGSMYQRRSGFAAAPVSNGRILLVGGQGRNEGGRSDAEYFNPRDPVIPPRR